MVMPQIKEAVNVPDMPQSDNAVVVRGVSKTYGEVEALRDMSLEFPRGQLTSLLGPSGCGKTTLLKIIAGLLKPNSGEIEVNGKPVKGPGPDRAFVFQDFALMPWANVLRNVAFGLELRAVATSEREAIAEKYIAEVGLAGFEKSYPHQLSGGMRQRVSIAIAFLNKPDLIIADEPTTALDVTIQAQIIHEAQKLTRQTGTAMIWITHDLAVVAGLADRISVMYAGKIVEQGLTDDVIDHPLHPYTIGLLGSVPTANKRGERLFQIEGMTPNMLALPGGCAFSPRCGFATAACKVPPPVENVADRKLRCFHPQSQAAAQ